MLKQSSEERGAAWCGVIRTYPSPMENVGGLPDDGFLGRGKTLSTGGYLAEVCGCGLIIKMKKSIGKVHAAFGCEDCGVEYDHYMNAQALAAKHAKHKRHRVHGEVGFAFVYDGKNEK